MKLKTSFVTNSSTCAFIFLGFKLEKSKVNYKQLLYALYPESAESMEREFLADGNQPKLALLSNEDYEEILQNNFFGGEIQVLMHTEAGCPNDDVILVGTTLARIYDDSETEDEIEIEDMLSEQGKIIQLRDKLNTDEKVKLFAGIQMC